MSAKFRRTNRTFVYSAEFQLKRVYNSIKLCYFASLGIPEAQSEKCQQLPACRIFEEKEQIPVLTPPKEPTVKALRDGIVSAEGGEDSACRAVWAGSGRD